MPGPSSSDPGAAVLAGILVVSVEQAVAAPYATSRLSEAGARVIKVERPPGGDFARHYDKAARGESAHFVWLNQGKESVLLDFKQPDDAALLRAMVRRADIFVQNLAPGAAARAGFDPGDLRASNPRLITCSISGYGEAGAYAAMKSYDNLVQAEAGIFAVTGEAEHPAKVGVPICDIGAGIHAYLGILEALLERQRTGRGRHVAVSLFESVADWMTVPYLFQRYAPGSLRRSGLHHASIAPYGAYAGSDGAPVMLCVQNDAEWLRFCSAVLRRPELARDPRFAANPDRVRNRGELDGEIGRALASLNRADLTERLRAADIPHARIRDLEDFARHPALATSEVDLPVGTVTMPRRAAPRISLQATRKVPALGEHSEAIHREFGSREAK